MVDALHPDGVLRTRGLTKSFGLTPANVDVSIVLRAGRIHALLGENGAGKSTLIAQLAGIMQPDAGDIELDDKQLVLGSPRAALDAGIVTVFQRSSLVSEFTVAENIRLLHGSSDIAGDWLGILTRLAGARIEPGTRVADLDLGTRQLIEISRAFSAEPRVLILDEPTALMSSASATVLGELLDEFTGRGGVVLLVTHKLAEVADAEDFTVMRHGRVVLSGEAAALSANRDARHRVLLEGMFGNVDTELRASERQDALADDRQAGSHPREQRPVVLRVQNLSTDAVSQRALRSVSFDVRAGEILGIAGISGNGQEQLVRVLTGLDTASQGSIELSGERIESLSIRERMQRGLKSVTADRFGDGVAPSLSVALNLLLERLGSAPFWRRGVTNAHTIRDFAEQARERADIRVASVEQPAGNLSGGNAQKLLLARESGVAPVVTVLEHPTHGLDAQTVIAVYESIHADATAGSAVMLVSADLDELVALADRVLVFSAGQIVAEISGHEANTYSEIARAISSSEVRA